MHSVYPIRPLTNARTCSSFAQKTDDAAASDAAATTADKDNKTQSQPPQQETRKVLTTVTPATMPGHTGYLTFATLPPLFARSAAA